MHLRAFKSEHNICGNCRRFPVTNKKYGMCRFCNYERTHPGDTFENKEKRKRTEKIEEKIEKMRFSIIRDKLLNDNVCSKLGCGNTITNKTFKLCSFHNANRLSQIKRSKSSGRVKEDQVKSKLSQIKKEAKLDQVICEGCGKNSLLDYSHILSVGKHKSLELDKKNKNLLCRTCHQDWESWNPNKIFMLNCIDYNLNYIRKKSEQTFWKLYFKCIDHQMFKEAKIMEKVDNDFKKEI
jgi:hypothetical protein